MLGIGLYTVAEAAAYTGIKPHDIRRWLFGYTTGKHRQPALWSPQLAAAGVKGLGFHDLLEIRFVQAFRQHGVSLQAIRTAAEHARALFQSAYPFTCQRFLTDGRKIFAEVREETGDETLLELGSKQYVFKQVVRPSLYAGIEYDQAGEALKWFPLPRSQRVVLDPQRAFGKPIVSDAGVPTGALYAAYQAERNVRTVAALYEVSVADVEAAIRFEQRIAHREMFN